MKLFQKIIFALVLLPCFSACGASTKSCPSADELIFEKYKKQVLSDSLSTDKLLAKTAIYFLGTPYVGGTLEKNSTEQLIVNLRELDCTTFVESCVALTLTMQSDDKSFAHYKTILQTLRYRKGILNGYDSRLHYASDWIFDNEQKGIWKNITQKIGGSRPSKVINFMSTHSNLYPALKNNASMQQKITKCEDSINQRNDYFVLPKNQIATHSKEIKTGDIICFATQIVGLDYTHMAIAYWNNNTLTFIHASSAGKRVMIQPTNLVDYCHASKRCTGITVVRLNEK